MVLINTKYNYKTLHHLEQWAIIHRVRVHVRDMSALVWDV